MYKRLALDLVKIFNEKAYLSIVLDNAIKELKLSLNDKKVYTKIIYGVCENKMMIDFNLAPLIKGKRVKPFIKNVLRIGVYVIDYMNMKDHFIVNELVKIVKKDDYKSAMFVNGVLRNYQRSAKPSIDNLSVEEQLCLKLSLPLDLTKLLYKQYKDKLSSFFEHGNVINTYRINTLKVSVLEVEKIDAYNIGYLLYFFMFACGVCCYMLDINPFNQPGVEDYKKNIVGCNAACCSSLPVRYKGASFAQQLFQCRLAVQYSSGKRFFGRSQRLGYEF